jgi:hypothetical protein
MVIANPNKPENKITNTLIFSRLSRPGFRVKLPITQDFAGTSL